MTDSNDVILPYRQSFVLELMERAEKLEDLRHEVERIWRSETPSVYRNRKVCEFVREFLDIKVES